MEARAQQAVQLVVVAVACSVTAAATAQTQTYPTKPIRVVVPMVAGGAVDTLARILGKELTDSLGKTIVVENRAGANGNIGADVVAKATPDGYTLLIPDMSTLTTGPALYSALPFDPLKDFAPITMLISSPYGLATTPTLPVNSVKELIAYARNNPGKVGYAHLGTGSGSLFSDSLRQIGAEWPL